jgi:ribonuclease R
MIKGTGEDIHPTTLQKVQEEVEGRPEQMVISTINHDAKVCNKIKELS